MLVVKLGEKRLFGFCFNLMVPPDVRIEKVCS